jgi:hypothetical protein
MYLPEQPDARVLFTPGIENTYMRYDVLTAVLLKICLLVYEAVLTGKYITLF